MLPTDLRHALDPAAFAEDALGFTLDDWQRDALQSGSRRLLMNCCRQSGKTTVAAIRALHRVYFQTAKVVVVSPSERQSKEFYRLVRELADRLPMPPRMTEDTSTSATLVNGSRVISLPSSEATIRGIAGVDELIFDEASRVLDPIYTATRPMVMASHGAIVALSTPAGEAGGFGRGLTAATAGSASRFRQPSRRASRRLSSKRFALIFRRGNSIRSSCASSATRSTVSSEARTSMRR